MSRRRGRRGASRPQIAVALALVLGAGWVNRETLLGLVGLAGKQQQAARVADLYQPTDARLAPAAPLAGTVGLGPVAMQEIIEDPMDHSVTTGVGSAEKHGATGENEPPVLPAVRMILHSAGSRRALIEGRVVGRGDSIGLGKVVAVEPNAVHVQAADGRKHILKLAAIQMVATPAAAQAVPENVPQGPGGDR